MIPVLMVLALGAYESSSGSVDQKRQAAADARVEIEAPSGTLKIVGWDREEVQVTGTYGRGVDGVTLTGSLRRLRIEVQTDRGPHGLADLEVHVPAGAHVEAEAFGSSTGPMRGLEPA